MWFSEDSWSVPCWGAVGGSVELASELPHLPLYEEAGMLIYQLPSDRARELVLGWSGRVGLWLEKTFRQRDVDAGSWTDPELQAGR